MSDITNSINALKKKELDRLVPCAPKSKKCTVPGWPDKFFVPEDFSPDSNIAVHWGETHADVDLDCPEAVQLAPYVLPKTKCKFGRVGTAPLHFIYRTDGAPLLQFGDPAPGGGMIVELRAGNHLTLAPGSVHPTGEPIVFASDGNPSVADPKHLDYCTRAIAAATLTARYAWAKANHHHPSLGLAGVFAKAGVPQEIAVDVMRGMATFQSNTDEAQLCANVKSTYARHAKGEKVAGVSLLKDAGMSDVAIAAIYKWLSPLDGSALQTDWSENSPGEETAMPDWSSCVTTCAEFLKRDIPAKEPVIEGLIRTTDAAILYAETGSGKTITALAIANAIASGKPFAGCGIPKKRKVLYVDGEMGGADLQGLLKKMSVHNDVYLVPSIDLTQGDWPPDIADPTQQAVLIDLIHDPEIEVVIFDNLFSLAMIEEFLSNDDEGVVSVGKFGTRLRNEGITSIFVHHATKSGKGAAGASRLTVPFDLVIHLSKSGDDITLAFDKSRGRRKPDSLTVRIVSSEDSLKLVDVTPPFSDAVDWEDEQNILQELSKGPKGYAKLAKVTKLTKWRVEEIVKSLISRGDLLRPHPKGPPHTTEKGKQRLKGLILVDAP